MSNNNPTPAVALIVTHDGVFHADEVFACVALIAATGAARVIRTRDPEAAMSAAYVVDVGGAYDPVRGRFDHHQRGGAGPMHTPEGCPEVPKASFGLVWADIGHLAVAAILLAGDGCLFVQRTEEGLFGSLGPMGRRSASPREVEAIAARVNAGLVLGVDSQDVGVQLGDRHPSTRTVSGVISGFNPLWCDPADPYERDAAFCQALRCAWQILKAEVLHLWAIELASSMIRNADTVAEGQVLVLDQFAPWQEHIASREGQELIQYVVHPSPGDTWMIYQVPTEPGSFTGRRKLPAAWAGLRDEEVQAACGVEDAVFVHAAAFCGGARSKEGAIAMALAALEL